MSKPKTKRNENRSRLEEQTFTKWVNNVLRGHKKSSECRVENLQTDLKDGLKLVQVLETLSKEKMPGVHRKPQFEQQKIDNLNACFKFMEKANIKLVNIGNMDIYNGNKKLIHGLIWTLIRRFQIRSMGTALSTKEALLAWVNTQIPDQKVKNFTTDWNNGIALCALVDRIKPGLCPQYATLKSSDELENCTLGMDLAEDELGILKLLEPEDLCHQEVDELSVMTYISSFCKPANDRLLEWIQSVIPDQNITNFNKDWNNGINLSCLLDALIPGTIPDCRQLDPHQSLDNLVQALKVGEEHLGVKPVLTPSQLADPKVDDLNVATYLSRFQYARPIPQPHLVTCKGHGLFKAVVGQAATFEVDGSKGGVGELTVVASDSKNNQIEVELIQNEGGLTEVKYVPHVAGNLTIEVKWSDSPIPGSPFNPDAIDLAAFSFTGRQITGGQSTKIGSLVVMEAKGITEVSDLYVLIQHSDGHTETAKTVLLDSGVIECTYSPTRLGKDEVFAKVAGTEIPGSPFEVKVVDPSQCSVQMEDPPAGQPLKANRPAKFTVMASKANLGGIIAEVTRPGSSKAEELNIVPQGDESNVATFTPTDIGEYKVSVTCAEEDIRGSPLELVAIDPAKCQFLDAVPSFVQVGKSCNVRLSVKGAGEGSLDVSSSQTSVVAVSSSKSIEPDIYTIQVTPNSVGEVTMDVKWEGTSIAPTPCSVKVCDATKCSAYGPGLTEGRGKSAKPFHFTVQTKGAGKGELVVKPHGKKATYAAEIVESSKGTYSVNFTTYEVGVHTIDVLWGDAHIPNSPFKVDFVKVGDAAQFTVTGDGLKEATAQSTAKCLLVGPTSGLLADNILQVKVSGDKFESKVVSKDKFDPKCGSAVVCISDNDNGSYSVQYAVPTPGTCSLSITSDGEHIPGSPFNVKVLPPSDASKCRAFGKHIDNPNDSVVDKSLEFKVDTTNAGSGNIVATATGPASSSVPVFTAEDKSSKSGKVYALKIDPKHKGKHRVSVLWSGVHIPGSPFTFDVGDPKDVVVLNLPDSSTYVARVNEPISFAVDASKAGKGDLKCVAKLDGGKLEPFTFKPTENGKVSLTYTPRHAGHMEIVLTYSGENVFTTPWQCDITNPSSFQVIPPKDHIRQNDYAKFIVSGLSERNRNKIKISATHPEHLKPTIKDETVHGSTAVYRFTAKKLGEYEVNVKVGSKHIAGSPFWVQVANPDGCKVKGDIPTVLPIGATKKLQVNTASCGSGELTFKVDGADSSTYLDCKVVLDPSNPDVQTVKMTGLKCGKCSFRLQWGGFDIPKMPVNIVVVDPSKCSLDCEQVKSKLVKTSDKLSFTVNTYNGGNLPPEVVATGPKARYSVEVKKISEGEYTASFTPWQDGSQTVQVSMGGVQLQGAPVKFEAVKPLDVGKLKITGDGLRQAVANRFNKVTILAGEAKLLNKGRLAVAFKSSTREEKVEMDISDEQNGSYIVSYKPKNPGKLKMRVAVEGKDINGSPFDIEVLPEPDASMCRITDASGDKVHFLEGSALYHRINTPVVLSVDVSKAGTGTLKASGRDPNGKVVRVLAAEEYDEMSKKRLYTLRFDPAVIGTYALNLSWDSKTLPNAPYQIRVVDPKKCSLDVPFPMFLQPDQMATINVCTAEAGEANLDVVTDGASVEAKVDKKDKENFTVTLKGIQLGKTLVQMKYGGFSYSEQPHAVSVCDPKQCGFADLGKLDVQVGVPFTITVKTENAGKADLQVKPVDSEMQYTFDVREESPDEWKATCTAWNLGEHELKVLWGEWELPGSPIKFNAVDPKRIKVSDIPDPQSYVAVIGEPISFSVDYSEAGQGSLECSVIHGDGEEESVARDETNEQPDVAHLSVVPKVPGKMELVLKYNGVDLISPNLSYEVPDPSMFQVIPPKGYGKINDVIKFAVTGVTADTELTFKATHLDQEAVVTAEKGKDESNIIAQFRAENVGEYEVEVKLKDQHVAGSPFTVKVANPEGCSIDGVLPSVVHSGGQGVFEVDTSSAGPGDLGLLTEVISGEIEPALSQTDDGKWSISSSGGVGQCKVTAKWADYIVKDTPFVIQFVESSNVTSSCDGIINGTVKQGEEVSIHLDASRAGQTVPVVKAVGPKSNFAVQTTNNNDGTFTLTLNPYQVGENAVTVLWGGKDIPGSPFKFNVSKAIEARTIIASGEGTKAAMTNDPTTVSINAPDSGLLDGTDPSLTASLIPVGSEEDLVNAALADIGGGSYKLTYTAIKEGDYELEILFEKQHIYGSPFKVHAFPSPKADKCTIFGKDLQDNRHAFKVNSGIQFGVDITDAGKGELTITGKDPSGKPITTIFTNEQERGGKRVKLARYTPETVGHHILELKWEGIDIPDSPLDFSIVDPSKCIVKDLPPQNGVVQNEDIKPIHFSILCDEAGDVPPEVSVSASGVSEPMQLQPSSKSASVFNYEYTPGSFGNVAISVLFGGFSVPNSPFKFAVVDPNRYSVSGLNLPGKYARIADLVVFDISSKKYGSDDVLDITMHGPKGEKDQKSVIPQKGKYKHSFTPMSAGSYDIFVECLGVQVSGSPLQINVVDPHKCQIFGRFPSHFQVKEEEEVVVNTQGAGEGEIQVLFSGEKEHHSVGCRIVRQDINSYSLLFKGKQIDSTSVSILWGGFNIKGSPFHINISDASKCKVHGTVLTSLTATTGEKLSFSVDTKEAGKSELSVVPKGPSATYKPDIKLVDRKYNVSFTPWEVGQLSMDVCWGNSHIPNSPFLINVENSRNICNATGDGLKTAVVGQESSFTIITSEMGLLGKKAIDVSIAGVRSGRLKGTVTDNVNGTYTVSYTPQKPGAYVANVTVNKNLVLGSPFKINVVSAPDASKCIAGGPALQPKAVLLTGSHLEVTVDSSEAGTGKLEAIIHGPNEYSPKVYMSEGVNGLYSIKFQATFPGRYSVQLLWSGQEIPGSPFNVRVHPAPDASKVRAYGSGLEDGYVNTPGEFLVDTRFAGVGTITVNVHGIKDSFRITAKRSESDSRIITVRYDPTKKGEYVVRVLWDGVHIPRSPFLVNIRGKPGSRDSKEDIERERKGTVATEKAVSKAPTSKGKTPTKAAEKDSKVLDSSFAKAAPVYDVSDTKKGKKVTPKKKDKKRKTSTPEAPPVATVGPVARNLKMKQNLPMAMALQGNLPEAIPDEDKLPKKAKRAVLMKKKKVGKQAKGDTPAKKQAVPQRGRPTSPKERLTSPTGRPTSPAGRPTSPKGQPTSSKEQATSPKGRPTSPKGKPTSPKERATSPKRRLISPKKRPISPKGRPTSPKGRPVSPKGKPTSPKGEPTAPKVQPTAQKGQPISPTVQPTSSRSQQSPTRGPPTSPSRQQTSPQRQGIEKPSQVRRVPVQGQPTSPTGRQTSPQSQVLITGQQPYNAAMQAESAQPYYYVRRAVPREEVDGPNSGRQISPQQQGPILVRRVPVKGQPTSPGTGQQISPQSHAQGPMLVRRVPVKGQPTSPTGQQTSPQRLVQVPVPGRQSYPGVPSESAQPYYYYVRTSPREEPDGLTRQAGATAATKGTRMSSPPGRQTSPSRVMRQEVPQQVLKRQTSPPKSQPVPGRAGSRMTSPPPKQSSTPTKTAGKPTEHAALKQHSTKLPTRQAAAGGKPASSSAKSPTAAKPVKSVPPKQSGPATKQPPKGSGGHSEAKKPAKVSAGKAPAQPGSGSRGATRPQQSSAAPRGAKGKQPTSPRNAAQTSSAKPSTKKTPQK